jgi:hypothetical protein
MDSTLAAPPIVSGSHTTKTHTIAFCLGGVGGVRGNVVLKSSKSEPKSEPLVRPSAVVMGQFLSTFCGELRQAGWKYCLRADGFPTREALFYLTDCGILRGRR